MTSAPALALLAVFTAGLLAWSVAVVLAVLALAHGLTRAYRGRRPRPRWVVDELPPDKAPDNVLWLACHSTACGHMQTRHDVAPEGAPVCRACGTPAASA
ncbi:hypothetical protein [Streptomyces sp. NBC_01506]|uniref:hypothetical protein n=1 Tax=Streptomyces sp. NBC_01506 TaxID=2903887 RepID=UPI00386F5E63